MKLTNRGNSVFVLPLPGKTFVFRPGESHKIDEKDFEALEENKKKNIEAMKSKGELLISNPQVSEMKSSIIEVLKEEKSKSVEKSSPKSDGDILDGNYKTVIKRIEEINDKEVLVKLLEREQRPSVKKVIQQKLDE